MLEERWNQLAKPPKSLGQIEASVTKLLGRWEDPLKESLRPSLALFCADHGLAIHSQIPSYPYSVTSQMFRCYLRGGGAINVLARGHKMPAHFYDCGIADPKLDDEDLKTVSDDVRFTIAPASRFGTRDLLQEDAMTSEEFEHCLGVGESAVAEARQASRANVLVLGEMGIGNTTSASCLAASLLDTTAQSVSGKGAGQTPEGLKEKVKYIEAALARLGPARHNSAELLRRIGGFEIVALYGAILSAYEKKIPVVLDGFIVSVAALAAVREIPDVRQVLIPATLSSEPGHRAVINALDAGKPLLDLGLGLGEASGAALAYSLLSDGVRVFQKMATLSEVV